MYLVCLNSSSSFSPQLAKIGDSVSFNMPFVQEGETHGMIVMMTVMYHYQNVKLNESYVVMKGKAF